MPFLDKTVKHISSILNITYLFSLGKPTPEPNTPAEKRQHAVKLRRIADREARRTRRRQARQRSEYTKANHDDGISSDDEESKSDIVKYQTDRGNTKYILNNITNNVQHSVLFLKFVLIQSCLLSEQLVQRGDNLLINILINPL